MSPMTVYTVLFFVLRNIYATIWKGSWTNFSPLWRNIMAGMHKIIIIGCLKKKKILTTGELEHDFPELHMPCLLKSILQSQSINKREKESQHNQQHHGQNFLCPLVTLMPSQSCQQQVLYDQSNHIKNPCRTKQLWKCQYPPCIVFKYKLPIAINGLFNFENSLRHKIGI